MQNDIIIGCTRKWIETVVVGLNLCPFAAREVKNNSIYYIVDNENNIRSCLSNFLTLWRTMDNRVELETSFSIYSEAFKDFNHYLDFLYAAEQLLKETGYEGIYQLASFHPLYLFEGSNDDDPANYTNRSPYPMIHVLREESLEKALEKYPKPELIPERNVQFTRSKGIIYMQTLYESCLK